MAGMEQLEVHSKSYLVRWVNVSAGHTISWSIQPKKKSINFGIFKHPGTTSGATPNLPSSATFETGPPTPALEVPTTRARGASTSRNDRTFVVEKLSAIGMKQVHWAGKCEADKVSMGTYDVPEGEGGMYGLVFDNTFSKTVSKTATFVLMTYPSNTPPKSGHHMHYAQTLAGASSTSLGQKPSPGLGPVADSSDSLPTQTFAERPKASYNPSTAVPPNASFLTGILQKKRRKRNQGYARRFFTLDFTISTLAYYRNDHSSSLRGSIPLSLAAIGANDKTREISVDSGAEVWQLRANNVKDFNMWKDALDRASRTAGMASPTLRIPDSQRGRTSRVLNEADERDWTRVESLVSRISGTRDAVRRLAQDTDPKYHSASPGGLGISSGGTKLQDSLSPSPSEGESNEYFPDVDRKAFWKRKASSSGTNSPSSLFRRSVSAQVAVGAPSTAPPVPPLPPNGTLAVPKRNGRLSTAFQPQVEEDGVHDHCMAILRDLDSVVEDFSVLLTESRQRRTPAPVSAVSSRRSIDSQESTDEFFDANDETAKSQLLTIRRDSGEGEQGSDDISDGESLSSSENEGIGAFNRDRMSLEGRPSIYPTKPKSLSPLPLEAVKRRSTVTPPKQQAPSIISFLRKNVGKDLSTISMPVTSNEPTSALQRLAEQLEYSELLDAAVTATSENGERLVYMAAFAISSCSNMRVKERATRKPFNPMLGETFELVREDKGYRFIAEKVVHRPVRMACQAESEHWTFIQSATPVQNFWGKSMELNTEGRVRIFLHASNEHYSWTIATSFLRNVIAGEKYVEPVGTMTIIHENTGAKAVCTFKAGGMFAGRSEEVSVQVLDATGSSLPMGAQGKWTSDLLLTNNGVPTGKTVWKVGDLVDKPSQHYGFTAFAATLNQVTAIEDAHLPPTDSRLRPDQRAAEVGEIDRAEALKARLEERQRARRRVMEEHGEEWHPRWFAKVAPEEASVLGDEELWRLKGGKDGYWEERERGSWEGVTEVLQA